MTDESRPSPAPRGDLALLLSLAAFKLLVQFTAIGQYGYFRDELYYIACSEHLALGYVDHPPLSIALLAVSRALIGDSLFALRLLPALAGAATVLLTGLMTREMGGGRFAQALSALAVIVAPIYLGINHLYSMNSYDLLFWTAGAFLIVRLSKAPDQKTWLLLGLVLGLGLLNKISMLWFGAGFAAGLLLTPHRRSLTSRGPWLAAGIAALLFAPHIGWQIAHSWPTLEFIRNATSQKMAEVSTLDFIIGQVRVMNPLTLPIWLTGLLAPLLSRKWERWRILSVIYLAVLLLLVLGGKSRASYLTPAYPMLLAIGSLVIEGWYAGARLRWLRWPSLGLLAAGGAVMAPLALPILPVETYIPYAQALGFAPSTEERKEVAELPQHYADMFGWEEMARVAAEAYHGLTPDEQAASAVFTGNYGEAGAIDFFGRGYGLPPAISGHNNYWFWGPGEGVRALIIFGGEPSDYSRLFERIDRVGTIRCGYCMPYERDIPVFVGRDPLVTLEEIWPRMKHYD